METKDFIRRLTSKVTFAMLELNDKKGKCVSDMQKSLDDDELFEDYKELCDIYDMFFDIFELVCEFEFQTEHTENS